MALDNPLHALDTANIETEAPVIPWTTKNDDGFSLRNVHERALGDRDIYLLNLLKAVRNHALANVSPQYPFTENATLKPSQAICYDNAGAVLSSFVVDPSLLKLSNSFLADLKLIISNEFREPYVSKMMLRRAVDPSTLLVQIFVDLEISARYTGDQKDHIILQLVSKAYNDVQDNSAPSSRDDLALNLALVQVDNHDWLNSGIIRFGFIGSVQSSLATSWSVGTYSNATVEGFSTLPNLGRIEFTFTRQATAIAEIAYNLLGNLQNAIPFLDKIKNFPFDLSSTAGKILAKYITDLDIAGPAVERVFIKRIRRYTVSGDDVFNVLFAYNLRDDSGNYLGTVNVGLATVTKTSASRVAIKSLASNQVAGVSPTWLDEVAVTNTIDNLGVGTLVTTWTGLENLFKELLATPVTIGSPSPIDVSPVSPDPIVGLFADENLVEMVEDNSRLDTLSVDIQGVLVTNYNRPLGVAHATKNQQVTVGGVLVNRRCCYGQEAIMRDFYGILSAESLVDNAKIPLEDEWYDSATNTLKRYQIIQGKRKWRTL